MKKLLTAFFAFVWLCAGAHVVGNEASARRFAARLDSFPDLARRFAAAEPLMSPAERDAMTWLYAYMPLSDLADHSPEFYLDNVRSSLATAAEMEWGARVPDREWRHFVLPLRINNETLDSARRVFHAELARRVAGMSMADAILETNHWCHEKVTYRPSDARTSSPLATVCNALGRCGEESTFLVAALRSIGIPARQVYTPRWAHTDDNHAWVEAWADGKWYFLGACEPEPVLNLGWFNAPASRGMLMTTNVIGEYDGPEEVLAVTPLTTTINVTSNYAAVAPARVRVVYPDGSPATGVTVRFCLYNYAEFYPIATKTTDSRGEAQLTAGLGDLVAWASDGRNFGFVRVSPADPAAAEVVLKYDGKSRESLSMTLTPPKGAPSMPSLTEAMVALNESRKAAEDSMRRAYESTFADSAMIADAAVRLGLDRRLLGDVLTAARGHHAAILEFLTAAPAEKRPLALELLETVSEKDLHDAEPATLADHLAFADPAATGPMQLKYVVNPRVEDEWLTPYKSDLRRYFGDAALAAFAADPASVEAWIVKNIRRDDVINAKSVPTSPSGVLTARTADSRSRAILFVAICRTAGVPARVDRITGKTQWADTAGNWHDVSFGAMAAPAAPQGALRLDDSANERPGTPKYYSQFTLSRLDGGLPRLMEFDEFVPLDSVNAIVSAIDAGQYALVTGQRLADGAVMVNVEIFPVAEGEETVVPFAVAQNPGEIEVLGSFNSEDLYRPDGADALQSLLSTTGRGYYVLCLLRPGHEPSAHVLNDLSAEREELESLGRPIMLIYDSAEALGRHDKSLFPSLPATVHYGSDSAPGAMAAEIAASLELQGEQMPIVIVADTFNRVVFISRGYTIGLGRTLTDILRRL